MFNACAKTSPSVRFAIAIAERCDELGLHLCVDVEDTALATFQTEGGALVQVSCARTMSVKRDDLVVMQIDGAEGSELLPVW